MSQQKDEWNCTVCTFLNKPSNEQCEMCETKRETPNETPKDPFDDKSQKEFMVHKFLLSINTECCQLYFDTFIKNGYNQMENIKEIEMEDLKEMGVMLAWRRRILNAIKKLQSKARKRKLNEDDDHEIRATFSNPLKKRKISNLLHTETDNKSSKTNSNNNSQLSSSNPNDNDINITKMTAITIHSILPKKMNRGR